MATVKKLLLFALCGAIFGDVIATLIAPGFLAWYASPGAGQALCDCPAVVRSTARDLIRYQLIGAGIGAAAALAVCVLVLRRKPRVPEAAPGAPPP